MAKRSKQSEQDSVGAKDLVKWVVYGLAAVVYVFGAYFIWDIRTSVKDVQADNGKIKHAFSRLEAGLLFVGNRALTSKDATELRDLLTKQPMISSIGQISVFPIPDPLPGAGQIPSAGQILVGPPEPLLRSAKRHIDAAFLDSLFAAKQHEIVSTTNGGSLSKDKNLSLSSSNAYWVTNRSDSSVEVELTSARPDPWGPFSAAVRRLWTVSKRYESIVLPPLSGFVLKPSKSGQYRLTFRTVPVPTE